MKFIKEIVLILVISCSAYGQKTNKYMGFIKIQDSLVITYKLEFTELNGEISGYSLTDFGGDHETKSKIAGAYNEEKKLLEFKEVDIIYTKSNYSTNDFCNIHLEPTRFKMGSTKLAGNFRGKFSDGTECINGEIEMNSVEKIDKRVTKFTKKIEKSNRVPDSLKQKLKNIKLLDTINLNVLKKNEITSVVTTSSKVNMVIYDGGQIDNDIITILINDKELLSNYTISNTKKRIEIPMDREVIKLTVLSESVGSIGSNTAIIEIIDTENTIKTMTNLNRGEKTRIHIIKK